MRIGCLYQHTDDRVGRQASRDIIADTLSALSDGDRKPPLARCSRYSDTPNLRITSSQRRPPATADSSFLVNSNLCLTIGPSLRTL